MEKRITLVRPDAHEETIGVAVLLAGASDPEEPWTLAAGEVGFCYEAEPSGQLQPLIRRRRLS